MFDSRRLWITGATNGLGLALVHQALENGHLVAASGKESRPLETLQLQYSSRLLSLAGGLQAAEPGLVLQQAWGALDTLLVNAGGCDHMTDDPPQSQLFEAIALSNFEACKQSLAQALPLLAKGERPQVMVVLSRHSAQQLSHPTQPASASNSLTHWLREQRAALGQLGIDLTIVAPQPLHSPLPLAIPEDWTAEQAAAQLLERLERRQAELVLEVLRPDQLWPLPQQASST